MQRADAQGTRIHRLRHPSIWITGVIALFAFVDCAFAAQSWAAGVPGAARTCAMMLIVFAAAMVSSVAGFAFSALAGAPLALISAVPAEAVETMILASIAIQGYAVYALRHSIEWRRLGPFLLGGAATLPLGIALLTRSSSAMFSIGMGLFLVAYGAYMLNRKADVTVRGSA
jgi:uncharacterized membrane protein YfcA